MKLLRMPSIVVVSDLALLATTQAAAGPSSSSSLTTLTPGKFLKIEQTIPVLFSVDSPNNLGGALPSDAEPRDVIRFKSGAYARFFCPAGLGVPPGANLDAVYLEGGDSGNLVVSFDVPVDRVPEKAPTK